MESGWMNGGGIGAGGDGGGGFQLGAFNREGQPSGLGLTHPRACWGGGGLAFRKIVHKMYYSWPQRDGGAGGAGVFV